MPAVEIDVREEGAEEAGAVALTCAQKPRVPAPPRVRPRRRGPTWTGRAAGESEPFAELEAYRARGLFAARAAIQSTRAATHDAPLSGR